MAPLILKFGTRSIGPAQGPAALPAVKEPRYQLNSRLGEPQSRCGHFGDEKNVLHLLGIELRRSGRNKIMNTREKQQKMIGRKKTQERRTNEQNRDQS